MIKVFLAGGLGNQLFQLSFAQYLKYILKHSVSVIKLDLLKSDQRLSVATLLPNYSQRKTDFLVTRIATRPIDPWRSLSLHYLWGTRYDFRYRSDISPLNLPILEKNSHVVGYFQDYRFVRDFEKGLMKDLNTHLPPNIDSLAGSTYEVIHVRGGDYKSRKNRIVMGELSNRYYTGVLSKKSTILRLCISDDLEFARWKLRNIAVDHFFGPNELDPLQGIKIMQEARKLIVANSTFSWWGGIAAWNNLNSEVIFPKPFFKSSLLNFGSGLQYPNFKSHNSYWE